MADDDNPGDDNEWQSFAEGAENELDREEGEPAPEPELTDDELAAMMATPAPQDQGRRSTAPQVPSMPARPHVDRGPAGSLREQATAAGVVPARTVVRTVPFWLGVGTVAAGVAGGLMLAAAGWSGLVGWIVGLAAAAAVVVGVVVLAMVVWYAVIRPPDSAAALTTAWRERRMAGRIKLPSPQWQMLPDRVLSGTDHRLSFVLVGPAGVFITTPLPPGPYSWTPNDPLQAAGVVLNDWWETRQWEANELWRRLSESTTGRWPYAGHVFFSFLIPPRRKRWRRGRRQIAPIQPPGPPQAFRRTPVVAADQFTTYLTGKSATLPPEVVTDLAEQVTTACPPAATGTPAKTSLLARIRNTG